MKIIFLQPMFVDGRDYRPLDSLDVNDSWLLANHGLEGVAYCRDGSGDFLKAAESKSAITIAGLEAEGKRDEAQIAQLHAHAESLRERIKNNREALAKMDSVFKPQPSAPPSAPPSEAKKSK